MKKKQSSFVTYAKALTDIRVIEDTFYVVHLHHRMVIDNLLEQTPLTQDQKERLLSVREGLDRMWSLFNELKENIDE